MTSILALDTSLSRTGAALLDTSKPVGSTDRWRCASFKTDVDTGTPREYLDRILGILRNIAEFAATIDGETITYPDRYVIERPAVSKNMGRAHERGGLWWAMYAMVSNWTDTEIIVIEPNLRTKYATGSGTASKDQVLLSASKRYADAPITNNDEGDGVVLAAMTARLLGEPVEASMPKANLDAMKTVVDRYPTSSILSS